MKTVTESTFGLGHSWALVWAHKFCWSRDKIIFRKLMNFLWVVVTLVTRHLLLGFFQGLDWKQSETGSFLTSAEGRPYSKAFEPLRLNHILVDYGSFVIIESDAIIPPGLIDTYVELIVSPNSESVRLQAINEELFKLTRRAVCSVLSIAGQERKLGTISNWKGLIECFEVLHGI